MARRGETIENPITGERITFIETAQDTNGELLMFEYVLPPRFSIPEHIHPRQEERHEVLSGTLRGRVRGRAALSLLLALAVHAPQLRSRRFLLIALAAVLYIGGGFMVTFLVNVPMNEELAHAHAGELGPTALAQVRAEYEGPWNFYNGVRTVFSSLAFVAIIGACLSRPRQP